MIIGYARISTDDQKLILQSDALKKAGCRRIYEDTQGGAKVDRPGMNKMMASLRPGDTVVVWRLDRLSRSFTDLLKLTATFEQNDIALRSLNESIDTATTSGKLVFHVFGALAEFERNLIRERTNAGLQAARARGMHGGRPLALGKSKRALAVKLYKEKYHTVGTICEMVGISKPTLYKYVDLAKQGRA
jgi:DNA invertase Pin-like site-specific DNA recombinase